MKSAPDIEALFAQDRANSRRILRGPHTTEAKKLADREARLHGFFDDSQYRERVNWDATGIKEIMMGLHPYTHPVTSTHRHLVRQALQSLPEYLVTI